MQFEIIFLTLIASIFVTKTSHQKLNGVNTPPEDDEIEANECSRAVESPLLLAKPVQKQDDEQLFWSADGSSKFVVSLTGIWTSIRCEIAPGPEFTYRRYVFYTSPQDNSGADNPLPPNPSSDDGHIMSPRVFFRSIHFKFTDPNCQLPIFAFSAEGELTVAQSLSKQMMFSATPGSEEADITVYRVSITIFNASAFLASNYSVFSIRQQFQTTGTPPLESKLQATSPTTTTKAPTTEEDEDEDEETRRERKDIRFSPTCNLERLWPHLAQQLPKLAADKNLASDNNLILFEMYNELEPTAEWFHWSPSFNNRRQRIVDEAERSKNEDRLDCLKKAGFNIDELLLLRIEKKRVYYERPGQGGNWSEVSVLKTGQIFRGIFGELNYKPAMYAANLLFQYKSPVISAICPLCTALAQSDIEENCYSKFFTTTSTLSPEMEGYVKIAITDASFLLPNMWPQAVPSVKAYEETLEKSERWVSTRCETRPYGIFLKRQLVFSEQSAALFRGIYLYYEDPLCTIPTYDLEIGGDFRLVKGVFNPYPGTSDDNKMNWRTNTSAPFGAAFLFNTNWARIRPRNTQAVTTLSEYSHVGNCGHASKWRLGEWQDVSKTSGCLAIGIRIPTEELQLVRLETASDGFNKATFLYIGDAQSKRPLSPSLMTPSAISTIGYNNDVSNNYRESTSAEIRMGLDFSLFEQIRPTSFIEPMIKCRDLISINLKNNNQTTSTVATTITAPLFFHPVPAPVPPVPNPYKASPIAVTSDVYYVQDNDPTRPIPAILANIDNDNEMDIIAAEDIEVNEGPMNKPALGIPSGADGTSSETTTPLVLLNNAKDHEKSPKNSASCLHFHHHNYYKYSPLPMFVITIIARTMSLCILLAFCLIYIII